MATTILMAYIKGIPLIIEQLIDMLNKEPYLASYAEVVGIGGLPLIISLICRDDFRMYGITRENLGRSPALSIPLVLTLLVLRILHGVINFKSFNLQFLYNIW
ncbi:MAG: hypothetical protein J7L12_02345, partial [Desulfurococcales archaeon]|nr:hypothetical protein [Desulfurococcales archaeon]